MRWQAVGGAVRVAGGAYCTETVWYETGVAAVRRRVTSCPAVAAED